ncbi:MAG: hypothetical protein LKK00_05345 [Intestinimonas sp.]|jgi:hypothetical protein|nr:hypothetical protein [Intestinimonas sp.]
MKRAMAVLLCAALALALLLPANGQANAAWDDNIIFMAANYTLMPLNEDTMPLMVGGTVYVPYTLFDSRVTGVDLGVYNGGQNKTYNTYTIYSAKQNLTFELGNGLVYDYFPDGNIQKDFPRAFIRNGMVYLPAYKVCSYFGLQYSYLYTTYGYPLVRVKNQNEGLSDAAFIDSASTAVLYNLNNYYHSLTPDASPAPTDEAAPPVQSKPPGPATENPENKAAVRVYLAFRCDTGEAGSILLGSLKKQGTPALFLFTAEQLAAQDTLVRQVISEGHTIGLIVPGRSVEAAEDALRAGNALLAHIARASTHVALPDGASSATVAQLERDGWLCWRGDLDGVPADRTSAWTSYEILTALDSRTSATHITMDDSNTSARTLSSVLSTLRRDQYDYRPTLETEF